MTTMEIIKNINLGVRFILELCLLASLAIAGLSLVDNRVMKWVAFAGLPILAATIWGLYIAPKAQHRLEQPHRLIVELHLFCCTWRDTKILQLYLLP